MVRPEHEPGTPAPADHAQPGGRGRMPCRWFLAACTALTVASLLLMAVAWQSERTDGFGIGSVWTQARVHRGEVELWCIELEDSRVADVLREIPNFEGFAGYGSREMLARIPDCSGSGYRPYWCLDTDQLHEDLLDELLGGPQSRRPPIVFARRSSRLFLVGAGGQPLGHLPAAFRSVDIGVDFDDSPPQFKSASGLTNYYIRLSLWLPALIGIGLRFITLGVLRLRQQRRRKRGFCFNCGYNLTGLPQPRCPECGTMFDPGGRPDRTES